MLCQKRTGFYILFFSLLLSSFVYSSSVSAIDNFTLTYNKNNLPSQLFTPSDVPRKDFIKYKWLKIECVPEQGSTCILNNYSNSNYTSIYSVSQVINNSNSICQTIVVFPSPEAYYVPLCSFYSTDYFSSSPIITLRYNQLSSATQSFSFNFTLMENLPSECPEAPTGTLDITENGTFDVSDYSTAKVNVPQNTDAPYNSKFDEIIKAIYVATATLLVIYFFYCIYRLIIKNSGVK